MTEERREKTSGDEDVAGPRRMLNAKQVLKSRSWRSSRSAAPRLIEWRQAGFRDRPASARTAGSGSRTKSSLGKMPSMNSIRTVAGVKTVSVLSQADKTHHVRFRW